MHGLSAWTQVLGSTYGVLARETRTVAFGLRPTSLRPMWFCLENLHQRPVFMALGQSGKQLSMVNSSRRDLVLEICDRVRVPLKLMPSQDFQGLFSSLTFRC